MAKSSLKDAIDRYHAQLDRQRGGKVWDDKRGTYVTPEAPRG